MSKRKTAPDRKWLSVLGGSALFGYLGCVPQESGPASIAAAQPAGVDSSARRDPAAPVVLRPDTAAVIVSKPDTATPVVAKPDTVPAVVVVRRGPTLRESCAIPNGQVPMSCTFEGMPLECYNGAFIEGPGVEVSNMFCVAGDTVTHNRHMGFNGIDKIAKNNRPDLLVRVRPTVSLKTRTA